MVLPRSGVHDRPFAFTLTELIAVVAMLGIGMFAFTPVLSRTRSAGQTIGCLHNVKQLIDAWQMYARDNNDRIVSVQQGGNALGGNYDPKFGPPWASGWLDWTLSTDNTNVAFLINERYAKLARYVTGKPRVFRCPADNFVSSFQKARGWTSRARSYSGSVGLGEGNAEAGPWSSLYRHVLKTSDLLYPSPPETFVFIEEHADSINDPAFISPSQNTWVDLPALRHEGGAAVSFADGHAELHKWAGSLTPFKSVRFNQSWFPFPVAQHDPDLHWVSFHTQRTSPNSY